MGSSENRLRKKWQDYSNKSAMAAEYNFFDTFSYIFNDTEFLITSKPKEFNNIYADVKLSKIEIAEIYDPGYPIIRHGFYPDYSIQNIDSGKTMYVEVKRQDGWVEGKTRHDGRGNAHERLCKYFTPGLLKIVRKQGNINSKYLPFWIIFSGDITRDPCRVREIRCWFQEYNANLFFWRNASNTEKLVTHFIKYIKPIIS